METNVLCITEKKRVLTMTDGIKRKIITDYKTAKEAAEILGVSYSSIRNMEKDGRLIPYVVNDSKGGSQACVRLFKEIDLHRLLKT